MCPCIICARSQIRIALTVRCDSRPQKKVSKTVTNAEGLPLAVTSWMRSSHVNGSREFVCVRDCHECGVNNSIFVTLTNAE